MSCNTSSRDHHRRFPGSIETYDAERNDKVIDWALAWPDLAPHVGTGLLYDSRNRIRHVNDQTAPGGILCEWCDDLRGAGRWVPVPSLSDDPAVAPMTAFEAAIVCRAVLRPREAACPVTFSRGDGVNFVMDGKLTTVEPTTEGEVTIFTDFPCSRMRNERVKRWIMRQGNNDRDPPACEPCIGRAARMEDLVASGGMERTADASTPQGKSTTSDTGVVSDKNGSAADSGETATAAVTDNYRLAPSGASVAADEETNPPSVVLPRYYCPTCAFGGFSSVDGVMLHLQRTACGLFLRRSGGVDVATPSWRMMISKLTFRISSSSLTRGGNPRIGRPIRVCRDGVPWFVMWSSPWIWSSAEIAAIEHSIPFHRCYRVAELPFVVFDSQRPRVPQLAASCDEIWTADDVLKLFELAKANDIVLQQGSCVTPDGRQVVVSRSHTAIIEGERQRILTLKDSLSVVTGPHIGFHDDYLHLTLQYGTDEGICTRRVYVHRRPLLSDGECAYHLNTIPAGKVRVRMKGALQRDVPPPEADALTDARAQASHTIVLADDEYVSSSSAMSATCTLSDASPFATNPRSNAYSHAFPAANSDALFTRLAGVPRVTTEAKCEDYVANLPLGLPETIVEVASRPEAGSAHEKSTSISYCVGANDSFIYVANIGCHVRHDVFAPDRFLRMAMRCGSGTLRHPCCSSSINDHSALPTLRLKDEIALCIRVDHRDDRQQSKCASISDFLDNAGFRDAIASGSGRACPDGIKCASPLTCPDLHFLPLTGLEPNSTAAMTYGPRTGAVGLVKKHTPSLLRDTVLVIEKRKHFQLNSFFPNAGLQTALRFGRGKLCRVPGAACPDIQRCPRLHLLQSCDDDGGGPELLPVHNDVKGTSTKPISSVYVRNMYRRANTWDFVDDAGLQLAMSVGDGSI